MDYNKGAGADDSSARLAPELAYDPGLLENPAAPSPLTGMTEPIKALGRDSGTYFLRA